MYRHGRPAQNINAHTVPRSKHRLLSTLRWHMTKVHKLKMPIISFDRAVHSVRGMPICAKCGEFFTRWDEQLSPRTGEDSAAAHTFVEPVLPPQAAPVGVPSHLAENPHPEQSFQLLLL